MKKDICGDGCDIDGFDGWLAHHTCCEHVVEVSKPGDFDHMADEELTEFIKAQVKLVRELERQLLPH